MTRVGLIAAIAVLLLLQGTPLAPVTHGAPITGGSAGNDAYLGQEPPGDEPVPFAPRIISTEAFEFGLTLSPDGRECFFTRRPDYQGSANRVYAATLAEGKWSQPFPAPFAGDVFEFLPSIDPTGNRLFFYSERPIPGLGEGNPNGLEGNLWFSTKESGVWSEPIYLNAPANRPYHMTISATADGTLYYSGVHGQQRGVFCTRLVDGEYSDPEYLPPEVNSIPSAHPFIAPDEDFLIFDSRLIARDKPELHISFRTPDGGWTVAMNMGPVINATKTEFGASLSPDGKYLFFHRRVEGNGDIYWVDASIIERLRKAAQD